MERRVGFFSFIAGAGWVLKEYGEREKDTTDPKDRMGVAVPGVGAELDIGQRKAPASEGGRYTGVWE
jgi:hypothetical protein